MRLWTVLGIGLLASGFASANVSAEEQADVVKLLQGLSSKLDALDGQIAGMNERIEGLEKDDAVDGGLFSLLEDRRPERRLPAPQHRPYNPPRFDHEFNAVLQHEFEELKKRERAKRVACVLQSLLNRYGHCCEKCLQPAKPTPVKPASMSYGSTFLTPACYTTKSYVTSY